MIRARVRLALAPLLFASALLSTLDPRDARAQPPAEGDAIEVVEYTVQAGDTCGRIAQRMWGNARRYDLIHSFNPGMGPPPHHLVAGTVLRLPRVATAASLLPDARVTAAERRVTARPRDEETWRDAHIGLDLYRGWHVVTEERSSAELTFRDTSVVAMRADTLVIIFGDTSTRVRRGGTDATLERGSMRTALGALRGTGDASGGALALHVNMPSSQADLSGGSSVLSVDDGGTSRVSAHVGDVRVRGESGPVVRVPEGMGSAVAPHARPTPPRPLPPAPVWENGPRRFFGASGRGAVISGGWAAAPAARTYHVEIARQQDGREVVASTEVPDSVTRFELHGFPPGTYYVRVSTIDTDFFESRPSEPLVVTAESATITLPGASEGASFPAVDPSEEPGPLTLPLGTHVALPADVHCEGVTGEIVVTSETLPVCSDASGPVALFPVRVETVSLRADASELVAGETREVSFGLVSGELPAEATLVAHGVTVESVRREGDHLVARLTAPAEESSASIDLVLGSTVLSSTPLAVTSAPVVETTPPAVAVTETTESTEPEAVSVPDRPSAPGALTEAVGATPFSESVGLRDLDVRGVGGRVSVATVAAGDPLVRVALEAFGSVLDDQLRFSVAMPIDAASPRSQSWQRGSADLVAGVGWLPLRRGPVSLLVDAAIWVPTELDHGLSLARLVPSIEAAWLVGGTFHLRTRQAAMLDLADHGARLWSSAYGMDARMIGPFGVGFEVELVVGDPDGTGVRSDYAFVPEIVLDFDPIAVHVGGRFGLNRPTYFGPAGLFVSARLVAF
ncbi:MAG: hypothetical protein U0234_17025 [Sandaracinus sp.]